MHHLYTKTKAEKYLRIQNISCVQRRRYSADADGWHQTMLWCENGQVFDKLEPGIIDKTRFLVRHDAHVWEIDEFYGEKAGHGRTMGQIAKALLDTYFEDRLTGDLNQGENQLS